MVEVAFQYNASYAETIFTFVNNINTTEGGTHLIGFKAALTRCINNYAVAHNLFKDLSAARHLRRRHARGPVRRPQRQDARPPVRGPDQDQARQLRGQGDRRVAGQRAARGLPRGEPDQRQADHPEGRGRGPGPRRRPQGPRARPPEERPRVLAPCPGSWPTARSATRPCPRSTSSRAIPPAARPSRAATGASRPSCPSGARSSTSRRPGPEKIFKSDEIGMMIAALGTNRRRGRLQPGEAPLPQGHHHDRRRRRRLPHPDPPDDLLLPADEAAHRAGAPLHRPAAALQDHPRPGGPLPQGGAGLREVAHQEDLGGLQGPGQGPQGSLRGREVPEVLPPDHPEEELHRASSKGKATPGSSSTSSSRRGSRASSPSRTRRG